MYTLYAFLASNSSSLNYGADLTHYLENFFVSHSVRVHSSLAEGKDNVAVGYCAFLPYEETKKATREVTYCSLYKVYRLRKNRNVFRRFHIVKCKRTSINKDSSKFIELEIYFFSTNEVWAILVILG